MMTMKKRIGAQYDGVPFAREYEKHVIHRAAWEKTFTVWRGGRCLESGLKSFNRCLEWIETHKGLCRWQIVQKQNHNA